MDGDISMYYYGGAGGVEIRDCYIMLERGRARRGLDCTIVFVK